MARRKKRKSGKGILFLLIAILIVLVAVTIFYVKKDTLEQIAVKKAAKIAIEQVIQKETGQSVDIDEIKNQMEEKDAESLDIIIDKYANKDKMEQCLEAYKEAGTTGVKDYIKNEVQQEDIQKMLELYGKYKDNIVVLENP